MNALKLTRIGNSVGVILPKELLARLKVDKGDLLHVTDSPDGIRLTPHDPYGKADLASLAASCAVGLAARRRSRSGYAVTRHRPERPPPAPTASHPRN